jgi:hypothetical protein
VPVFASLLAGAACQDKPDEAQPRPNNGQGAPCPYIAANKSHKSFKSPYISAVETLHATSLHCDAQLRNTVEPNNHKNQSNHLKITVQTAAAGTNH